MNRADWQAFYRALRVKSGEHMKADHRYGSAKRWEYGDRIISGFTYWTVRHMRGQDAGLAVYPSIIRDRSTLSRIDDALFWASHYRQFAKRERWQKRNHVAASKACIQEAREIRLTGSIFHAIAA